MVHTEVYKIFKKLLPAYAEQSTEYFPNGKNSIRVRINHGDYIFTYSCAADWKFETIDSFLKNNKK